MGVKKLPKAKREPAPKLPETISGLVVKLEPLENASTYYANHIEIGSTAHDFSIICARLPPKLTTEQFVQVRADNTLIFEPEVQIIVPATLIVGMIKALTVQKELYERLYNVELKGVGET